MGASARLGLRPQSSLRPSVRRATLGRSTLFLQTVSGRSPVRPFYGDIGFALKPVYAYDPGLSLPPWEPTLRSPPLSRTSPLQRSRPLGGGDPPHRTAPRQSCTPPGISPGRAWGDCPSRCPADPSASRTARDMP